MHDLFQLTELEVLLRRPVRPVNLARSKPGDRLRPLQDTLALGLRCRQTLRAPRNCWGGWRGRLCEGQGADPEIQSTHPRALIRFGLRQSTLWPAMPANPGASHPACLAAATGAR